MSCLLSADRLILSVYLRLLVFHCLILIPTAIFSDLVIFIINSLCKSNRDGHLHLIPFLVLNCSVFLNSVLVIASCPLERFLRRIISYSDILFSLTVSPILPWTSQSKGCQSSKGKPLSYNLLLSPVRMLCKLFDFFFSSCSFGISDFMHDCIHSLWKIWSTTLLAWGICAVVQEFAHLSAFLFVGICIFSQLLQSTSHRLVPFFLLTEWLVL